MIKKGKQRVKVEEHRNEDEGDVGQAFGELDLWDDDNTAHGNDDAVWENGPTKYDPWNQGVSHNNAGTGLATGHASHAGPESRHNLDWAANGVNNRNGNVAAANYTTYASNYSQHNPEGYGYEDLNVSQNAQLAQGRAYTDQQQQHRQRRSGKARKESQAVWAHNTGDWDASRNNETGGWGSSGNDLNNGWGVGGNSSLGDANNDNGGASGWDQPQESGWGNINEGGWAGGQVGQEWRGSKIPKVTVTSPNAFESRTVLSDGQQQQLLNKLRNLQANHPAPYASPNIGGQEQERGRNNGKKSKKSKKKRNQEQQLESMAEEPSGWTEGTHADHFTTNLGSNWGNDAFSNMPSKVFALAADGQGHLGGLGPRGSPYMETRFIDSHGAALEDAHLALYSQHRLARNRLHWLFSPYKDPRVSSLLEWIEAMSYQLASYGLIQFLQSRERGALITNAEYRPPESPAEPAFDWITYDLVRSTMDRTLQESLAFYDPSSQVLVFVFLLSKTGNSMAIWRRKLIIPNNLRLAYSAQITQAIAGLQKQYPIHLDEMPPPKPELSAVRKTDEAPKRHHTKRKWFKWF